MSERKEILTLTNNFVGELVLCRKYKLTRVDFYWILIWSNSHFYVVHYF